MSKIIAAIAAHKAAWDAFQIAPDDIAERAEDDEQLALEALLSTGAEDRRELDALIDHLSWFTVEEVQRAGGGTYDIAAALLAAITLGMQRSVKIDTTMKLPGDRRWCAVLTYRSENGPVDVEQFLEEIEDLQEIVERGPDWNALQHVVITLNRSSGRVTIEQADAQ